MHNYPCLAFATPRVLNPHYLESPNEGPEYASYGPRRRFQRQMRRIISTTMRHGIGLSINIEGVGHIFKCDQAKVGGKVLNKLVHKADTEEYFKELPYSLNLGLEWSVSEPYKALYGNTMREGGTISKCYDSADLEKLFGAKKTVIAIDFEPYQNMYYHDFRDFSVNEETK